MLKKFIVIAAAGLLLAGCSHIPSTSPTTQTPTVNSTAPDKETAVDETAPQAAAGTKIDIKAFAFSPKTITVKPGATVTVTNSDIPGHSVTSDDGTSFDTGVFGQGKTVTFTAPTKVGSYPFHCTPHPNMKATLVIAQ